MALPQYAGTKQKILEVLALFITRDTFSLKGRGDICTFDADGFMERDRAEDLMGWVVKRAQQKLLGGNVVNIEPTLSGRRYKGAAVKACAFLQEETARRFHRK